SSKIKNTENGIEIRRVKLSLPVENPNFQFFFKLGMLHHNLADGSVSTEIAKIRVGNLDLVFIPGEPFPDLVRDVINSLQNGNKVIFISQSNDSLGYFIPLSQFKLQGDEWAVRNGKKWFIGHESESLGYKAGSILKDALKNIFNYKTVLAIGAHADDLTIWAGGTLKKLSFEGNKVICVRICDDWEDCVGITKEIAIKRNRQECNDAYRVLGAKEIIHLDYPSDMLAGVNYLELREKIVSLIRQYKPNIVISFDLNGMDEENQDHVIVANAVNEACWQASVDLLYPESVKKFGIHRVGERYLFARNPTVMNFHVDISEFIDDKIKAINSHETVIKNFFHQYLLMARANRLNVPLLEANIPNSIRVNVFVRLVFGEIGQQFGVRYAEIFNKIGAGILKELASPE
ncbi:MAG: PIG-L deacetylase family protein, partial [Promethearchaeota archaeon]